MKGLKFLFHYRQWQVEIACEDICTPYSVDGLCMLTGPRLENRGGSACEVDEKEGERSAVVHGLDLYRNELMTRYLTFLRWNESPIGCDTLAALLLERVRGNSCFFEYVRRRSNLLE